MWPSCPTAKSSRWCGWPPPSRYDDMLRLLRPRARRCWPPDPTRAAADLRSKVKALAAARHGDRARDAQALDIAVNFTIDGHESLRRRAEALHRLRRLRHRLQRRRQEHAVHELPADGAQRRGRDLHRRPKWSGWRSSRRGGWRIRGRRSTRQGGSEKFTLDAANVILLGGFAQHHRDPAALGDARAAASRRRLARSFSGNGDFFGLAYNGDFRDRRAGLWQPAHGTPG